MTLTPKVTEEHKRQRRLEIITAARQVFRKRGYLESSMQDIIDEVGLSRGAVYDYFKNKAHLFQAMIDGQDEQLWAHHEQIKQARPIWPAFAEHVVGSFGKYDETASRQIGSQIEFVLQSQHDFESHAWILNRYHKFLVSFTDILQTGAAIGEFHPTMPIDVIARFTISATDGIHLGVLAVGPTETRAIAQSDAVKQFLIETLRPTSL